MKEVIYYHKGSISKLLADIAYWRKVEKHYEEHNKKYKRKEPRDKRSS